MRTGPGEAAAQGGGLRLDDAQGRHRRHLPRERHPSAVSGVAAKGRREVSRYLLIHIEIYRFISVHDVESGLYTDITGIFQEVQSAKCPGSVSIIIWTQNRVTRAAEEVGNRASHNFALRGVSALQPCRLLA